MYDARIRVTDLSPSLSLAGSDAYNVSLLECVRHNRNYGRNEILSHVYFAAHSIFASFFHLMANGDAFLFAFCFVRLWRERELSFT